MCKETDAPKEKEPKQIEIPEGLPGKAPSNPLPKDCVVPPAHNTDVPNEVNPGKLSTFEDLALSDVNETKAA